MSRRILVWFWSGGGGGSQFAVRLTHRLGLMFGRDLVALSMRAADPTVQSARELGLILKTADIVAARERPLATAANLAEGARVLAAHAADADIVIAAMNFSIASALSLTLAKPLVYCAHDPRPHIGDYAARAQRMTQGFMMRRAAAVVALSRYAGDELAERPNLAQKLRVAPLASVFEPRPAPVSESAPVRLLLAGRMIAYKGLDLLAAALERIASRDDWRLTIAGHGPALTDEVLARFSHRQIEAVRTEWLSDDELDHLIAGCDVLLAPYIEASQSGVVAQALARGKPCVVTPVGALPEQVGGGRAGWIADSATPDAFARALTQALDDHAARAAKSAEAIQLSQEMWEGDHWSWLKEL